MKPLLCVYFLLSVVPAAAQERPTEALSDSLLFETAHTLVVRAPAIARVWPGFWPEHSSFVLANFLARDEMPFDDRMPSVAGLLVDDGGMVWAKAFEPAQDSPWLRPRVRPPAAGGEWSVLDPTDGTVVGRVELPSSFVPLVIGDDEIIGKDIDAFGVERVVVHELRRGEPRE